MPKKPRDYYLPAALNMRSKGGEGGFYLVYFNKKQYNKSDKQLIITVTEKDGESE